MKKIFLFFSVMTASQLQSQIVFSTTYYPVGDMSTTLTSNDFNGDGNLDILTANYFEDSLYLFVGNGLGNFSACTIAYVAPGDVAPRCIISGDFNLDTKADIAIADYSNTGYARVLYGNGASGFSSADSMLVGSYPFSICSADFNGDGNPDLATVNSNVSGTASILLGTGSGFMPATTLSTGSTPVAICYGDFNGDTKYDIAVVHSSSGGPDSLWTYIGNGTGTFAIPNKYLAGSGPYSVCSKDINADGFSDLAVANVNSNNVSVFISQGVSGNFSPAVNYYCGYKPFSVTCSDINSDGKLDLSTANYGISSSTSTISVLLGNGMGSFSTPILFADNYGPWTIINADFNEDGKPDLATANQSSSNIAVYTNYTVSDIISFTFNDEFLVYPNPASDDFYIESTTAEVFNIQISDIKGRLILAQEIKGSSQIKTTDMSSGVYFLNIQNNNSSSRHKLIITK